MKNFIIFTVIFSIILTSFPLNTTAEDTVQSGRSFVNNELKTESSNLLQHDENVPIVLRVDWNTLIVLLIIITIAVFLLKIKAIIKFLNDTKIMFKILGLVFILIVTMIIVSVYGIVKMGNIGEELKGIAEEDIPLIEIISEINSLQMDQSIQYERALRFGEVLAEKDIAAKGLKVAEKKFMELADSSDRLMLKAESIAEKAIRRAETEKNRNDFEDIFDHLKSVNKEHEDIEKNVLQVFELIHQNKNNEAEILSEKIEKEQDDLNIELEAFVKKIEKFTEEASLRAEYNEQAAYKRMITLTVFTSIAGILIGIFISRTITRSLKNAINVMAHISGGDLITRIEVETRDEIGQLLNSVKKMVLKLAEVISDVTRAIGNVASGSQEISAWAEEMSGSAEKISQGAAEQAASVEEVSASIEQMVSNIRQNADNAMQTEKIALKVAKNALEGGRVVGQTVSAMKQIADKIMIIEDISRQTDLLALNAAVEAARAGEHGKGFAVVASEVRKLSERSRKSSADIRSLLLSSVDVAEKAGEMLSELIPDIQKTTELVQEISASCSEQSMGGDQINKAVQQLDQVIQQNASASEELASSSEEMASTSEELASQGEQLRNAIAFFTIIREDTDKISEKQDKSRKFPDDKPDMKNITDENSDKNKESKENNKDDNIDLTFEKY